MRLVQITDERGRGWGAGGFAYADSQAGGEKVPEIPRKAGKKCQEAP